MMKTLAIINPHSAGGKTGRDVPMITRRLADVTGDLTVAMTNAPMDAVRITSVALRDGYERIVAVGGDGTINEVVNGFFQNNLPINPDAEFALLNLGTGGDFRKTFGIDAGLSASLERIADGRVRRIDVGRLSYVTNDGKSGGRHFANIASFGMSGDVMHRVNRATTIKRLTGRFAFTWGSLVSMVRYKARPVRLKVDNLFDDVLSISTCAVCNGQFFGGGMRVAPDASPDDGFLDVIVIGDAPKREIMKAMNEIYSGAHVNSPHVKVFRGTSVIATPVEATGGAPVYLEVDGETPGQLPAMFELLPKALKFRG
ncbi:MAG: diacylglycerol kinase family lipid kinase [Alphaproteobacteria bacterium]|nr:diacylglycerol kinase family lipid kinase [Alphaproteobacteria bacterium]